MTKETAKQIVKSYFDWTKKVSSVQNPDKNPQSILESIFNKIDNIDLSKIDKNIIRLAIEANESDKTMFCIEKFAQEIMKG